MKIFFDFLPIPLFFLAFKYFEQHQQDGVNLLTFLAQKFGSSARFTPEQAPILIATFVVIVATIAQVIWVRLRHRKVDLMLWMSLFLVLLMGGLTLFFHNSIFIKWKPTLLYWLFAIVLFASAHFWGRNLIRIMMESKATLPDALWAKLNAAWAVFFIVMGSLNLFVAYHFSTDTWVNFKLFGGLGLMLGFAVFQAIWISAHLAPKQQ